MKTAKNLKKIAMAILVATIGIFSNCSNDAEITISDKEQKDYVLLSEYEATLHLIKEFEETHGTTTTKSVNLTDMEVTNVIEKEYLIELDDEIIQTKSSEEPIEKTQKIKLYTVEFKKGETKGFSIATADKRVNRVYAFVPKGEIADTVFNLGFKEALWDLEVACKNDLKNYYVSDDISTKATVVRNHYVVQPITRLEWDQNAPYNLYCGTEGSCTGINWSYRNRPPAGCVPIACAQIIAYLCPPALSSSNISSLRTIPSWPTGATTGDWTSNIAVFIRSVGTMVGVKYKCDGSPANIKSIRDEFNSWGVQYSTKDGNINHELLAYNLYRGYPHLTQGISKKTNVGHAWIWEGLDCYGELNHTAKRIILAPNSSYMLYCNWGWGGYDNGWFSKDYIEKPTDEPAPYLKDNYQIYITGTTFAIPSL